jgi:hypothetical protein
MRVRNFVSKTQETYLHQVSLFARHFANPRSSWARRDPRLPDLLD